jgi:putative flippase GtrA
MRRTDVGRSVFNREFLRQGIYFVLSGGLNTLATYLLYLLLLNFLHYQIAYATSFIAGILLSYVLSTRFVFRTTHSWVKFSLFPLVYLISYAAGAAVLALSVNRLGIDQRIAPLVSACVTLPLSFVLSRLVLVPPTKPHARR